MEEKDFISVIICTYNRCESLKDTLDSLLAQECDGSFNWEVIVVDNNSKDKTKEVVESYMHKFGGKLRYVFEKNQGLSYARNTGIKEAKGEIIAFTDDDCIVEDKWLFKIKNIFQKDIQLDGVLGNAVWGNGSSMYRDNNVLRGNGLNMVFRKSLFREVGYFDINLGSGSAGCSADDLEFVYRARKNGRNIRSIEDIIVVHKHRVNEREKLKVAYRDCKGYIICWLKYVVKEKDKFALKKIYWFIKGVFFDLVKEVGNGNIGRVKLKIAQTMGALVGLMKGLYIWRTRRLK